VQTVRFIPESDTSGCTFDVKHHSLALFSKESLLVVVKDTETIFAARLEKLVVIIAEDINLLLGVDSLYNVPRLAADKLNLLIV
jgi:hypothetical protein